MADRPPLTTGAGELGAADAERDVRGFALKFQNAIGEKHGRKD